MRAFCSERISFIQGVAAIGVVLVLAMSCFCVHTAAFADEGAEPSPNTTPSFAAAQQALVDTTSDSTGKSAQVSWASRMAHNPFAASRFIPNPTTDEFIGSICEYAREIGQERGLYASVMIAQAVLESGSGSSALSKPPYNNLFGIKGAYRGRSVKMTTSEDDGSGSKYSIKAGFRSYPTVRESLVDYADLLTVQMGSFYAPAWKANAATYADACDYLQGHYATDTSYASKLKGIIAAYNLVTYDVPRGAAAPAVPSAASAPVATAGQKASAADAGGGQAPVAERANDDSAALLLMRVVTVIVVIALAALAIVVFRTSSRIGSIYGEAARHNSAEGE